MMFRGILRIVTFGLYFLTYLKINTVQSASSTNQLQVSTRKREFQHCKFNIEGNVYNTSDLLQCMNELAFGVIDQPSSKSTEETDRSVQAHSGRGRLQSQFSPVYAERPSHGDPLSLYYKRRPYGLAYQSPTFPSDVQSGYYPSGVGYPSTPSTEFGYPGEIGITLFDVFSSISQYDDLKCVPRILCEVATGVTPESGSYKQAPSTLENFGKNTLIGLLTALDITESSPVLNFAKAALLGYTSRGNPTVCYREYAKCPRNPSDLVHYLNNYNGGFFRFFSNVRDGDHPSLQESYLRPESNVYGLAKTKPALPPGLVGPETDRTGTGELKFDNPVPSSRQDNKSFFSEYRPRNKSNKLIFPGQESPNDNHQLSLNRVSKSLVTFEDSLRNNYSSSHSQGNPSIFLQDEKDQDMNIVYAPNQSLPPTIQSLRQFRDHSLKTMTFPKAKLYVSNESVNDTASTFTFPDGQKVRINSAFSKLFSNNYKRTFRKRLDADSVPRPITLDGYKIVNLPDMFLDTEKDNSAVEIVHPCDMICHDVRGTVVQFNQIRLRHTGTLSTLMTPDRPILDLSKTVPCEVVCLNRRDERKQISTVLSQVLKSVNDHFTSQNLLQDKRKDRKQTTAQSSRQQQQGLSIPRIVVQRFSLQFPSSFGTKSNSRVYRKCSKEKQLQPTQDQNQNFLRSIVQNHSQQQRHFERMSKSFGSEIDVSESSNDLEGKKFVRLIKNNKQQIDLSEGVNLTVGQARSLGGLSYANGLHESPQRPPRSVSIRTKQPPIQAIVSPLTAVPLGQGFVVPLGKTLLTYDNYAYYPCTGLNCSGNVPQSTPQSLTMCGGIIYIVPLIILVKVPICAVELNTCSISKNSKKHFTTSATITTTSKWKDPGGEDYPRESCLDAEFWNETSHECVPIKYDEDTDAGYTSAQTEIRSRGPSVIRRYKKPNNDKKRKFVVVTGQDNVGHTKKA